MIVAAGLPATWWLVIGVLVVVALLVFIVRR
jgi:hypothetical protein